MIALIFVSANLYPYHRDFAANHNGGYHNHHEEEEEEEEPIAIALKNNDNNIVSLYDEVNCNKDIEIAINKVVDTNNNYKTSLSEADINNYIQLATSIVTNSTIHGDIVEVIDEYVHDDHHINNNNNCCSSANYGILSLLIAVAQRTVLRTPHCNKKEKQKDF